MSDSENKNHEESKLIAERRRKLAELRECGNAYPNDFRRNALAEEFHEAFEKTEEFELSASADGPVQIEVQDELLAHLEQQLRDLDDKVGESGVILIESQRGVDHPRTKEKKETLVVDGENRLYFRWWIAPPLRVGVYSKRT